MVIRFEPGTVVGGSIDAPLTQTKLTAPKLEVVLEPSYGGVSADTVLKAPTTEELRDRGAKDQVRLSNPTDAEAQAKLQAALKEAIERGTELALNPNGVTGTSGSNVAGRSKVTTHGAGLKTKADVSRPTVAQADASKPSVGQPETKAEVGKDPIQSAKDSAMEDMYLKILAHQRQNERRELAGEAKKTTLKG